MGNSESTPEAQQKPSPSHHRNAFPEQSRSRRHHPPSNRSTPLLPSATSTPVPPALLPTSSSTSTTAASTEHATATVTSSPKHSRARSITSSSAASRHKAAAAAASAEDSPSSHRSDRSASLMGQAESREGRRPPSRSSTLPPPSNEEDKQPGASPLSRPVDVPRAGDGLNERDLFEPGGVPESPYGVPVANRYDRPPRLPLPIEEEVHTPGSPIITPQDLSSPLDPVELDGVIPRRTSVLSSTTVDDEEIGETDVFSADAQSLAPLVPTTVAWRGEADKVYVTGTFVNWERKFKLHRDEHGAFSATLQLKPGTHHLKFLVNDVMVTSDDYPTTVDFTNILVNYLEVVAPLPSATPDQQPPAPAEPMPIPGAALTAGQATATGEAPGARPLDIRAATQRVPETQAASAPQDEPHASRESSDPHPASLTSHEQPPTAPARPRLPRPHYTTEIPAFLLDLDTPTTNPASSRAKSVEQHLLPQPPSLPMFLGKSILNGNTPHKDDASVLLMPNHTVLNHLATSSIKGGVLATSGTTRYRRKFLTTIMYKPTSDDG